MTIDQYIELGNKLNEAQKVYRASFNSKKNRTDWKNYYALIIEYQIETSKMLTKHPEYIKI